MLFLQLSLFSLFGTSAFALFDLNDFPSAAAPASTQDPPQATFVPVDFGEISVSISDNACGLWSRDVAGTTEIMKIQAAPGPKVEGRVPKVFLASAGTGALTAAHIAGTWTRYEDPDGRPLRLATLRGQVATCHFENNQFTMTLQPEIEISKQSNPDSIPLPPTAPKDAPRVPLKYDGKLSLSIPKDAYGYWSRDYHGTTEYMNIQGTGGTGEKKPGILLIYVEPENLTPAHVAAGPWTRNRDPGGNRLLSALREQKAICSFNPQAKELTLTLIPDTETMKKNAKARNGATNPNRVQKKGGKKKAGKGSVRRIKKYRGRLGESATASLGRRSSNAKRL